jgi:hypothetical protein
MANKNIIIVKYNEVKCVGPDLRQIGRAASAALPAVTRNILTGG